MKSLRFASVLMVLLLGGRLQPALAQGIAFEPGDWQSVVAKAKAENKLIFLDTYTTWCGPCQWMDKNVYPDAKVDERFNAQFVNYKIDAEKGEGIDLARKYQVTAYPTYLFVAPDESLVYRTIGSRPVEKFIEEADKAAEAGKGQPIGAYEAEYAAGRRDAGCGVCAGNFGEAKSAGVPERETPGRLRSRVTTRLVAHDGGTRSGAQPGTSPGYWYENIRHHSNHFDPGWNQTGLQATRSNGTPA